MLEHEFNELAEQMGLTDSDGDLCLVEEDEHGHNEIHVGKRMDSLQKDSICTVK